MFFVKVYSHEMLHYFSISYEKSVPVNGENYWR